MKFETYADFLFYVENMEDGYILIDNDGDVCDNSMIMKIASTGYFDFFNIQTQYSRLYEDTINEYTFELLEGNLYEY